MAKEKVIMGLNMTRMEKLYVIIYQKLDITNNTIGVNFAKAVLVDKKRKHSRLVELVL